MSRSSAESKPSSASSNPRSPAGDGVVARFERAAAPFAQRFSDAAAVKALGESLPAAFAFVVVALAALAWPARFTGWADVARDVRGELPAAFALASIVMVVVLAFRLSVRLAYPAGLVVCASLLAFWLALPREATAALLTFALTRGAGGVGAFAGVLGASGLFTAIVVCLGTAAAIGAARRRAGPFAGTILGALAVVVLSALLSVAHVSIAQLLAALVSPLGTLGDSFIALALISAIEAILWLVGIHGPALLAAIVLPVYWNLQFANTTAAAHHEPIPHIVVVSTFLFVFPGGAGATLPLVLLLLRSPVRRLRTFAYATLLPSLINVNEPVIFGLPLAYNPVLAVPFVVAPVVLACTTYAALALGLVARPILYVPSLMPAFVNVVLATLDWRACVLAAANLAIAGAIWLPFVRVYERAESARTVARAA